MVVATSLAFYLSGAVIRPLTGAVRMANRVSDADPALVRVAGKHCESGDVVVRADYLPGDVRPGDLLAVPATGAYCWSLASNYNYLGRPAVVAVKDGAARAIVRRETEDDLLSRDLGDRARAGAEGGGHSWPPRDASADDRLGRRSEKS